MADSDRAIQQNATGDLVSVNSSSVLAVGAEIVSLAGAMTVTAVANTDAVILRGGVTEYARLTSAGLGIGNTSPVASLNIDTGAMTSASDIAIDITGSGAPAAIRVRNTAATSGGSQAGADFGFSDSRRLVVMAAGDTVGGIYSAVNYIAFTGAPLAFLDSTANVEVARLTSTGLGVGVTADTKLHVSTGAAATTPILKLQSTAGSSQTFVTNATPEGAITATVGATAIDSTGGNFYLKTSGSGNTGWSALSVAGSGLTGTGAANQVAVFSGTSALGSSSGLTYTSTGLGIGITAAYPLDVAGGAWGSFAGRIRNSQAGGQSALIYTDENGSEIGYIGCGNQAGTPSALNNTLYMRTPGGREIQLWTNNTQRMIVGTGGAVAIPGTLTVGTNSPPGVGSVCVVTTGQPVLHGRTTVATDSTNIALVTDDGARGFYSGIRNSGAATLDGIAALEAYAVSSNATLVLGTVNGNNPIRFLVNEVETARQTSTEAVFNETGADINFRVESDNDTHALFVDAGTDRVGILNSAPSYTLDVTGVVRVNADGSDSAPSLIVGLNETNTGLFKASNVLGLTVDATEAMRWGSSTQDRVLITGGTLADDKQAFKVTGTVNGSATGDQTGASFAITGGSANVTKYGLSVSLSGDTSGLCAAFVAAATSTAIGTAWYDGSTGNYGSELVATQTNGTGVNVGAFSRGGLSSIGNFGSVGVGLGSANTLPSCLNVGATGIVDSSFVDTFTQICIGVLAHMNDDAAPTSPESACIFADNVASANIPFIVAKSDSTLKFKVDANGGVLAQKVVTDKTSGYSVTAAESGTVFTNEGAAGSVTFTLPSAAKGLTYTFYVAESGQDLIIIPASGDTVRLGADVIDSTGDVTSSTEGRSLTLLAIDSTRWVGIANVGAWTFTA